MTTMQLKKMIEEAVRKAIREEVGLILLEHKQQTLNESLGNNTKSFKFTTNNVDDIGNRKKMIENLGLPIPPTQKQQKFSVKSSNNPYADFIEDAGRNMDPHEARMISNPSLGGGN